MEQKHFFCFFFLNGSSSSQIFLWERIALLPYCRPQWHAFSAPRSKTCVTKPPTAIQYIRKLYELGGELAHFLLVNFGFRGGGGFILVQGTSLHFPIESIKNTFLKKPRNLCVCIDSLFFERTTLHFTIFFCHPGCSAFTYTIPFRDP